MLKPMDYVWITVILSIFGESFDHIRPGWYFFILLFAVIPVMDQIINFFKPQNK